MHARVVWWWLLCNEQLAGILSVRGTGREHAAQPWTQPAASLEFENQAESDSGEPETTEKGEEPNRPTPTHRTTGHMQRARPRLPTLTTDESDQTGRGHPRPGVSVLR